MFGPRKFLQLWFQVGYCLLGRRQINIQSTRKDDEVEEEEEGDNLFL
jgi:hypothetical protein